MYIVFEGTVGTGKTTQSRKLVEHLKNKYPDREIIWTHEPGGSEIAGAIRKVVQATEFTEEMDPVCEAYLYAAARAQSLRVIIKPVLERGGIVIADRSFISSMAYQGGARKLSLEKILEINQSALEGLIPDLVLYMNLDPALGLARTSDQTGDKFEKEKVDFFIKAHQAYIETSTIPLLKDKWVNIDASGTKAEVFSEITSTLDANMLIYSGIER
jgi:dTMP kinase